MALNRILSTLLFGLLLLTTQAQQLNITSGSAISCSGVIEDSGGPSAPYSDGENYHLHHLPRHPGQRDLPHLLRTST
jgi:hypothetical protein